MGSELFKFKFGTEKKTTDGGMDSSIQARHGISMSDESFKSLRSLIYEKSGIYYNESKKYLLESRILKRLSANNFSKYEEYINLLKSSRARDELLFLFEAITINETFFFRAEQQFEAFEKTIIPEIIHNKSAYGLTTIKIWSAASSTGEEAYTLAILINERLKPLFPNVNFQIIGTDINNAVIESAKAGIYKEYAIRNIPEQYLRKYFKMNGNNYHLSDEIKRMVRFVNLNLYDGQQMRTFTNFDVIFCCNVLIYFDLPSKQQVVSYLYDSLNRGGYLFIGYSESLHGVTKAFKLIHLPKALAYKKD